MMAISEKKMQIVMNNYFKTECTVNTSIREAFEKGFRIGVQKGYDVTKEPERKKGKWITHDYAFGIERYECDICENRCGFKYAFCPNCGAKMRGEE